MSLALPSPFGGQAVPVIAVLVMLTWLLFLSGGRRRRVRRAAILAYLFALSLAIADCAAWLAGLHR